MTDFEEEYESDRPTIQVDGPSGTTYDVIHPKEQVYWDATVEKYLNDYKFTNASDLQDLDRVVTNEMLLYRYNQWVSLESDYWGSPVDVDSLNKTIKDKSASLDTLKKSLGINKLSREKDQGDSIADYIENLRRRAQAFGIKRNEEAVKAISLFHELIAMMTFYDNCSPEERREEHIDTDDLLEWIRGVIPEFLEIDRKFRTTDQKYWINSM